jgi:hypothetical protein
VLAYSLRMAEGMKRCAKCRETKAQAEFHRSVSNADGRASRCKECRRQDSRDYLSRRREAEAQAEERGSRLMVGRRVRL